MIRHAGSLSKTLHSIFSQSALAVRMWKTFGISSLLLNEPKKISYCDAKGNAKSLETMTKENGAGNIEIRTFPPSFRSCALVGRMGTAG